MKRPVIISVIIFVLFSNIRAENNAKIFKDQIMQNYRNYPVVFLELSYSGIVKLEREDDTIFLKNNDKEENYILFSLLRKNKQWFEVVAWNSLDESYIGQGCIQLSTPIFIYSNEYNPQINPLKLYFEPTFDSPYIEYKTYTIDAFEVVDVYKKWLKIRISINDGLYFVWLSPNNQCANVYSTCN